MVLLNKSNSLERNIFFMRGIVKHQTVKETLIATIGLDRAENEPSEVSLK